MKGKIRSYFLFNVKQEVPQALKRVEVVENFAQIKKRPSLHYPTLSGETWFLRAVICGSCKDTFHAVFFK
jgi:hypothetical protein